MPSIAEILASQASASPAAPKPAVMAVPQTEFVEIPKSRHLGGRGDEPIPFKWPADEGMSRQSDLVVCIDDQNQGWVGIQQPDGRLLYLLGPMKAVSIPF